MTFAGTDITNASSRAVYLSGIARTFQRSRLALPLSIFDNIMIGNHKRLTQGLWFNLMRRGAFKREFAAAYRLAARARSIRSSRRWRRGCSSRSPACR